MYITYKATTVDEALFYIHDSFLRDMRPDEFFVFVIASDRSTLMYAASCDIDYVSMGILGQLRERLHQEIVFSDTFSSETLQSVVDTCTSLARSGCKSGHMWTYTLCFHI